jgi:hypothetical protein
MGLTVNSLTSFLTTAGAAEQTANLTLDAAVAAASIAVPAGATLTISDANFSSVALANWRIQQANDGVTFFDVALFSSTASTVGSASARFQTGIVVNGNSGTNVVIRLRVTTPGGAVAVVAGLRGYTTT